MADKDHEEQDDGPPQGSEQDKVLTAKPAGKKQRRRKNKKKEDDSSGAAASTDASAGAGASSSGSGASADQTAEMMKSLRIQEMLKAMGRAPPSDSGEDPKQKEHKFWKTQPVPGLDEEITEHGPLDEPKTPADVKQEPYKLPDGFEWVSVDITSDDEIKELYELLSFNYVEDDDNMFRFDYSPEFLRWALTPPGYYTDWHVGLRNSKNGKLLAFISGVPATVDVHDKKLNLCEINFLCIHKKLRAKRLAPVLIKEVTRRVNLKDIWQAVYTAGVVLPRPVARCRYYHRPINPKKLVHVGFSQMSPNMTMARLIRRHKLPDKPQLSGWRSMEKKDLARVRKMVNTYLSKFKLRPVFETEEECGHWLLPREGVVNSYVLEESETKKVTDFISFYHLPSTVIGNDKYSKLHAAYFFYSVAEKHSWFDVMKDALIFARDMNVDVFNALDLMQNSEWLKDHKFGEGDGDLHYYLYNWACPAVDKTDVGLVLL